MRVSHLVTTNCLLILYYSLIYPYLSYCNLVSASTFQTTLHKIFVLQKRFVRIATRSELHTSSVTLQRLQILTIYGINIFQICVFTYKILFSERFTAYFTVNSQLDSHSTRNSSALHLPNFLLVKVSFQ